MVSKTPSSAHGRDTAAGGELFPEIHREQLGGAWISSVQTVRRCVQHHIRNSGSWAGGM